MDTIFTEITFDSDICTQKQYERLTGDTLNTVDSTVLNMYNTTKNKGIPVIETAKVKSSNTFLTTVQDKENIAIEKEKQRIENANIDFPYIRKELMTSAEMQLFHFMKNNLCQNNRIAIFPKVRLGDIVDLDRRLTTDMTYFWKVTNKHVDYLICRADTLEIICAVELDDYTHESKEAQDRDIFVMSVLDTVGIKTVRIRTKIKVIDKTDLELIDEYINQELAPNCPYCGMKMIPRKSMKSYNRGHRFWGCPNYLKDCRCTINIDDIGEKLP